MAGFRKVCLLIALVALISGCGGKDTGRIKLVVWGLQSSEESKGLDAGHAPRPDGFLLHPKEGITLTGLKG